MPSKISFNIIATGSTGNAVEIQNRILIDCGVPFKHISRIAHELQIVLLTHIHGDHFNYSTIRRLAEERPALRWGCGAWLAQPLLECGVQPQNIDVMTYRRKYAYKNFSVEPVPLNHNVPNFGYKLFLPEGRVFYATDTNDLNGISAPDFDLYLVECNYEDEEIQERISDKKMRGEYIYEKDVLNNHLSKAKCDDWIYKNIGPCGEYVYLHGHVERGTASERQTD